MKQSPIRRFALLSASLAVVPFTVLTSEAAVVTRMFDLSLTNSTSTTDPDSKTTHVDFDADGNDDFSFTHSTSPNEITGGPFGPKTDFNGKLTLDAASTTQFLSVVKDFDALAPANNYAENLSVDSVVGSGQSFIFIPQGGGSPYDNRLLDSSGDGNIGAFGDGENTNPDGYGYVGFAFGDAAIPNYGYLTFSEINPFQTMYFDSQLNGAKLVSVSYETTPGVGITVVPEPSSLALLALGVGVALSRRRRH